MSSHHFVKEDQEPALAFASISDGAQEKIQPLLEWSPRLISTAALVPTLVQWRVKVDAVVCSRIEQPELQELTKDSEPIDWILHDGKPLPSLVDYLATKKAVGVQLIDFERKVDFQQLEKFPVSLSFSVFHEATRWAWIKNKIWEKWLPANTKLMIKSGLDSETIVTSSEGIVEICRSDPFWVGESW